MYLIDLVQHVTKLPVAISNVMHAKMVIVEMTVASMFLLCSQSYVFSSFMTTCSPNVAWWCEFNCNDKIFHICIYFLLHVYTCAMCIGYIAVTTFFGKVVMSEVLCNCDVSVSGCLDAICRE